MNNIVAHTLQEIQEKFGGSVYPLYKDELHEPFMELEKGFGYMGVVLYDEKEDKIISHLTGKPQDVINTGHIKKYGKAFNIKTVSEYKELFGLNKHIPLVNKTSNIYRERMLKSIKEGKMNDGFSSITAKKANDALRKKNVASGHSTIAYKNKYGLCDAQIAARLVIIKTIVKREQLTSQDLFRYDSTLYTNLRGRSKGDFESMLKKYDIEAYGRGAQGLKYKDAELLGLLRMFVLENKRLPYSKKTKNHGIDDFPDRGTYAHHFGSWGRAKMLAGIHL